MAQQEASQPQAAPYSEVLTSKMKVQPETGGREVTELQRVEQAADHTENKIRNAVNAVCVMFLFGAFCAIWAQNTARNPVLWFLLGAVFNFATVIVILRKNAKGHRRKRVRRKGSSYPDLAGFY